MSNLDIYGDNKSEQAYKTKGDRLKSDGKKAQFHLLPLDVLEPLVRIYEFGAEKYYEDSWREFDPTKESFNRIYSAMMRHIMEWQKHFAKGEFAVDEESGLPTSAHIVWNAVMLVALEMKAKEQKK